MLNVTLVGDKALAAHMDAMPDNVRHSLKGAVTDLTYALQARVKRKLTNDVLNVVTGKLRDSIAVEVIDSGNSIIGRVFSGGEVKYAAIHEFGGTINHPGGTPYMSFEGRTFWVSKVKAMNLNLPVTQPHQITMPERSFLRSSLAEMKDQIVQTLTAAAVKGAKQ